MNKAVQCINIVNDISFLNIPTCLKSIYLIICYKPTLLKDIDKAVFKHEGLSKQRWHKIIWFFNFVLIVLYNFRIYKILNRDFKIVNKQDAQTQTHTHTYIRVCIQFYHIFLECTFYKFNLNKFYKKCTSYFKRWNFIKRYN